MVEREKPIKTVEVGDDSYVVAVLTKAQVARIADAVVTVILTSNLDVVLADRIRQRMKQLDDAENERELSYEHRRFAPGFEHSE